jgi:LmbE family N-acetylglucosaminyl deacetylase
MLTGATRTAKGGVLVLSPHCDDAPLSLGAALLGECLGHEPDVVIVFSVSRYTRDQPCTGPIHEVTAIRHAEERLAGKKAGYTPTFLGFGEPFVRHGFNRPGQIFDRRRAVEDDYLWPAVSSAVEDIVSESYDLVLAPLACGGHIDHRIVNRIVLSCCKSRPSLRVGFYEDLPYSAGMSDSAILNMVPRLQHVSLKPMLIQMGLDEKLALLRIYASQLSNIQLQQVAAYWLRRGGERIWLADATSKRG